MQISIVRNAFTASLQWKEGEEDETVVSIINQIPFPLGKPCGSTALCSSCRCADTTEAIFRPHFKTTVETVSLADPTIKMFIVFSLYRFDFIFSSSFIFLLPSKLFINVATRICFTFFLFIFFLVSKCYFVLILLLLFSSTYSFWGAWGEGGVGQLVFWKSIEIVKWCIHSQFVPPLLIPKTDIYYNFDRSGCIENFKINA